MSAPPRTGDTHSTPARRTAQGEMSAKRLEAFSDGVFAIAITLLVLDLRVPAPESVGENSLGAALAHAWPSYFAYLVSFLVIGIIWINHHGMFTMVRRVDRPVLFVNLALLLFVSALPFPTQLLADYLTAGGSSSHVAAAVYSVTMLAIGITFTGLWTALTRDAGLLHQHIDGPASRNALRRFGFGSLLYAVTIGLSFVSALATLAVHAALAIYYCFDQLPVTVRDPDGETDTVD